MPSGLLLELDEARSLSYNGLLLELDTILKRYDTSHTTWSALVTLGSGAHQPACIAFSHVQLRARGTEFHARVVWGCRSSATRAA